MDLDVELIAPASSVPVLLVCAPASTPIPTACVPASAVPTGNRKQLDALRATAASIV